MVTAEFQSAHAVPIDYRQAPSGLRPVEPSYSPNAVVPYDYSQTATVPPNFVLQPNQYGPRITPGMQEGYPSLGAPSAEGTLNALRTEDLRRAGVSRAMGAQAEAQQAAAEAAARQSTGAGKPLIFDERGRLIEEPTAPIAFTNAPSALESAVQKMSGQVIPETNTQYTTQTISPKSGAKPYTRISKKEGETTFERGVSQAFAMTAEEKIAWTKAKADLAEVAPGFKTLNDKAIAEKMLDRAWFEETATKAREKAAAFEQLAARAADERARQTALASRERMMDLAEQMEEQLGKPRPVSGTQQGPKTRAAIRNKLAPQRIILNNMLGPD